MTTALARLPAVPDPKMDDNALSGSLSAPPRLSAAVLYCENCGTDTHHRILRLDRTSRTKRGRVRGIARCRECRWTHPFESVAAETVAVVQILSLGRTSERSRIELPSHLLLEVGGSLPGSDGPMRVQRIDTQDGRQVPAASSDEVATVWVVRDVGATVRVSIVEGRKTRTARLAVPRDTRYTVGDRATVEGARLEIAALRARGRTWRHPGDTFAAEEVQRLYCRPVVSGPPPRRPSPRGRASQHPY
jgi:uncharacterized Zn finger protein